MKVMKYRLMEFEGMLFPKQEHAIVYIIPVSSYGDEYRVIYPNTLEKNVLQLLYHDDLIIKQFAGCTPEAVHAVKQKLRDLARRRIDEYTSRGFYMFFGGIGLAVWGILSWTLPDPILLVDEIVCTVGGSLLAFFGVRYRRQRVPFFKEMARAVEENIDAIQEREEPLLSQIFESIKAKEDPEGAAAKDISKIDQIDADSMWLVDFLNVREMIESEMVTPEDAASFISSLQDVIPIHRIVTLERNMTAGSSLAGSSLAGSSLAGSSIAEHRVTWATKSGRAKRRMRRLRERIMDKYGLSDDALTVYCELYKSMKEHLENRGITF